MRTIALLFFITYIYASSQMKQATIDTVISYNWGQGQSLGRSPEYFPKNIFGKPDSLARDGFQSSGESEICSIGLGGEIIVGFIEFYIVDGPGPDFTVFENAFTNPINKKIFAEPAMISVSEDGINFIDFPFDSVTLVGCAGMTPTYGDKNCFEPSESGGDKFDLATIGLNRVRFIRIRDITPFLLDNPNHYYYDAILSGFDLDAVAGLNLEEIKTASVEDEELRIRQYGSKLLVGYDCNFDVSIYTVGGILLETHSFFNSGEINFNYPGLYLLIIKNNTGLIKRKLIII